MPPTKQGETSTTMSESTSETTTATAATAETKKNPVRVFASLRSIITRKKNAILTALAKYEKSEIESLTAAQVGDLEEKMVEYKTSFKRLETEWDAQLSTVSDDDAAAIEPTILEAQTVMDEVLERTRDYIEMKKPEPVAAATATTSTSAKATEKAWKPQETFKPFVLPPPDDSTEKELDEWIMKLKAYLGGHETQPLENVKLAVMDLIHEDTRGLIEFSASKPRPIFGENSVVASLIKMWAIRNPRTKRITRAFELRTLPNETHQQFSARAKEIWRRAEIGKLDEEHLLAQTILHKYTGENHKEIRSKVLDSDTFREKQGLIVPADIDEIALRIEIEKHYNTEDEPPANVGRIENSGKGGYKKGPLHVHLQQLKKENKCFLCAKSHPRNGPRCNRENLTCDFCGMKGHSKPACTHWHDKVNNKPSRLREDHPANAPTPPPQEAPTPNQQA